MLNLPFFNQITTKFKNLSISFINQDFNSTNSTKSNQIKLKSKQFWSINKKKLIFSFIKLIADFANATKKTKQNKVDKNIRGNLKL